MTKLKGAPPKAARVKTPRIRSKKIAKPAKVSVSSTGHETDAEEIASAKDLLQIELLDGVGRFLTAKLCQLTD